MTPTLLAALLASVAAGGVAYAFIDPLVSGEAKAQKRHKALLNAGREHRAERNPAASRREQVAQNLKEIEARSKARHRPRLEVRLAQAGLAWSKRRFLLVSMAAGLVIALLLLAVSGPLLALPGLLVGGLGLPRWTLTHLRKRRTARFLDELPNATDVIVRGIKAGLPLGDCLRVIATESQEPLRSEFRTVVESLTLGVTIGDALARLYERIPVPEANFFAIAVGIQQKSGGSLSETLGNLSRVLRERKKMAGKIKAMSMEAKASAGIIASLPFVVAILTYLSSPAYIELLWTTQAGKIALAASALWMATGVFVMKKMINFDF